MGVLRLYSGVCIKPAYLVVSFYVKVLRARPQMSSIGVTWELIHSADPQAPPATDLLNEKI